MTEESDSGSISNRKIAWWLWPNVLSFDAPIVAVVWLVAFSKAFGVPVSHWIYVALFLTVWCIYNCDRLYDVRTNPENQTARHQFVRRHFRSVAAMMGMAAVVTAGVALFLLPREVLWIGVGLGTLVGLYALVFVRGKVAGKEVAAGMIFAVGVAAPIQNGFSRIDPIWFLVVLILGLVCAFNCHIIEHNERHPRRKRGDGDLLLLGFLLMTFAVCPALKDGTEWFFFSLALAAGCLNALQMIRTNISPDAFRVLADVALLTPLIWLPFLP